MSMKHETRPSSIRRLSFDFISLSRPGSTKIKNKSKDSIGFYSSKSNRGDNTGNPLTYSLKAIGSEILAGKRYEECIKEHGERHPETMAILTLIARQYVNENKLDLAEQCYEILLDYNRENEDNDFQKQLLTLSNLDELSQVYLKQEKWYQAESSLMEAMTTRQLDSFIISCPKVLESEEYMDNLFHLGKVYRMLHNDANAIIFFQKLIHLQKQLFIHNNNNTTTNTTNTNRIDYYKTISELGIVYRYRGQFDLAEPLFLESLNGAISLYGHNHINTIAGKNNYANLLTDIKKYTDAEIMYRSIIESSLAIYGEGHINTLQYMNNLGLLYLDQNRKDDAHIMFEKCYNIGKVLLGDDDVMVKRWKGMSCHRTVKSSKSNNGSNNNNHDDNNNHSNNNSSISGNNKSSKSNNSSNSNNHINNNNHSNNSQNNNNNNNKCHIQ